MSSLISPRCGGMRPLVIQRPLLCELFALLLGMAMLGQPLSTQAQENGFYPQASLSLGTNGNFYGTTRDGGAYDFGSLFEITPQGQITTLYSFSVLGSNYVIFKRTPQGQFTALYSFNQ